MTASRFDLHHAHLFATDLDATLAWWRTHMGAEVLFDGVLAGARNVLLAVGTGRLNIYDRAPKRPGGGTIHHLGIRVAGLRDAWRVLQEAGISSPGGLREHPGWRYVMIEAPDGLLLELFEFDDPGAPFNPPASGSTGAIPPPGRRLD